MKLGPKGEEPAARTTSGTESLGTKEVVRGFFAGLGSGAGDSFLTFEDALEVDAAGLDAEARVAPFAFVVEAEAFDLAPVLVLRKASSSEDDSEESESESTVRFRFFGAGFGSTGTAFTAG